jgi:hypothetical protein
MTTGQNISKIKALALGLILAVFAAFFLPAQSLAKSSNSGACQQCHTELDLTSTFNVAINGTETTTHTTTAGTQFEVDYKFTGATTAARNSNGVHIAVPSGWTVTAGTANSPSITGWHTSWDVASGESTGWVATPSTATYFPGRGSDDGYKIRFSTSGWDFDASDTACNSGTTCGTNGTDLDGAFDTMGTDFRITVPGGTPDNTYYIQVMGIGHENNKSFAVQEIAVTVGSGGGDTTPPASTVNDPGVTLNSASSPYSITGTASDDVAVDHVDVDITGEPAWQLATGTTSWSFDWTLPAAGVSTGPCRPALTDPIPSRAGPPIHLPTRKAGARVMPAYQSRLTRLYLL